MTLNTATDTRGASDSITIKVYVNALTRASLFSNTTPYHNNCYIHSDHRAFCTGNYQHGGLSTGSSSGTLYSLTEVVTTNAGISNSFLDLEIYNGDNSCFLHSNRGIYCSGYGLMGEVGNNSTSNATQMAAVDTSSLSIANTWLDVTNNYYASCGVHENKKVYCWGRNSVGILGIGDTNTSTKSLVPVEIDMSAFAADEKEFVAVDGKNYAFCALNTKGKIYCWGQGFRYQIGDGDNTNAYSPRLVNATPTGSADTAFSQVAVNDVAVCAMTNDTRQIYCWGYGSLYSLGDGMLSNNTLMGEISHPVSNENLFLNGANNGFCAIHTNQKAYCWGSDSSSYVLGGTSIISSASPVEVETGHIADGNSFLQILHSGSNLCGIHTNGTYYCNGHNGVGGGGNGVVGDSTTLVSPDLTTAGIATDNFVFVSTSNYEYSTSFDSACAIHADNKLYCWGSNYSGKLGVGDSTDRYYPVEVDMSGTGETNSFSYVDTGYSHSCGIHTNGKLFCWGMNGNGVIGIGNFNTQNKPIEVDMTSSGLTNDFVKVGMGQFGTCALHTDGEMLCWGSGSSMFSTLGTTTTSTVMVPTEIDMSAHGGYANDFSDMAFSTQTVCAIHSSTNELFCWGQNDNGSIGDSNNTDQLTPVLVDMTSSGGVANDWASVTSNSTYGLCGIATTGEALCWGTGTHYNNGNAVTFTKDSPEPVSMTNTAGLANNWSQLFKGYYSGCGIHAVTGETHCWGKNDNDKLMTSSSSTITAPTIINDHNDVTESNDVVSMSLGRGFSCVIFNYVGDGHLYCKGSNYYGNLGNNFEVVTQLLTPVDTSNF